MIMKLKNYEVHLPSYSIGDTYAKYYEATISSRDERLEHFTLVGVAVSRMCRDPLLQYGAKAFADHKVLKCR